MKARPWITIQGSFIACLDWLAFAEGYDIKGSRCDSKIWPLGEPSLELFSTNHWSNLPPVNQAYSMGRSQRYLQDSRGNIQHSSMTICQIGCFYVPGWCIAHALTWSYCPIYYQCVQRQRLYRWVIFYILLTFHIFPEAHVSRLS